MSKAKKRLERVRAYKRIGLLEDHASREVQRLEAVESAINQGARQLTDAEVLAMRDK